MATFVLATTCGMAQPFSSAPARPATAAAQLANQPHPSAAEMAEQHTAHALEAAKAMDNGALYAFLHEMPKGGDLHNHITGAGYAESYVRFAIQGSLCVDRLTMQLSSPPCKGKVMEDGVLTAWQVEAREAEKDMALYRAMIDSWSMRDVRQSNQSGHDHFFDTFGKFGPATHGHIGDILAEVVERAANGNVQYLELMTSPDEGRALELGAQDKFKDVDWNTQLEKLYKDMQPAVVAMVEPSRANLNAWDARKDELLRCNDPNPAFRSRGCEVTVRNLYTVLRAMKPAQVFAQMILGFELARQDKRMVGINLVQPEDWPTPMNDFRLHMRMVNYLKELYPQVHVSLHAGELAPGLVPPEGLRFHIRESIESGKAERIGHGVDIMYEDDPDELLAEMARQNVMVEICLTSNDGILGVRGKNHPLANYLKAGVPVALATDDEGVSRSEMTREYEKAILDQNLDYPTLKKMARTSLEHSFLAGASLWSDPHKFTTMKECTPPAAGQSERGAACHKFLAGSDKAREEWRLEKAFADFEAKY